MIWVKDGDHKIILGEPGHLQSLDLDGLWAWVEGRQPRLAGAEEALAFIGSVERVKGSQAPGH